MFTIDASALEAWCRGLCCAAGLPTHEAAVVAASLVSANLRGHDSHGVLRVPQYLQFVRDGVYRPGAPLCVENERPAVLACDGGRNFGQVQAHRLLDLLAPKARACGVACGSIRNCGHIGRLGEYAERATGEGLALIATVNNEGAGQRVAPPGGIAPRLGTNPLCIGLPTESEPLIVDFSTSAVAEGKVRSYFLDGRRPVPEGWLLDCHGEPTTDPSVLYEPPLGSIVPMGGVQGYKAFGLALALDMLAGGLSGGPTAHAEARPASGNCVVFVLVDPAGFAGAAYLRTAAQSVADYVRATPRRADCATIVLPGDPERALLNERKRAGIPIPEAHWARLAEEGDRLGVPLAL
jgi:uncharacterized oxidoreductase